jgi:glycosyltransferase involved in cell wall biosynthesis
MKVCFIGDLSTTFIRRDYEILQKYSDVDLIEPPRKKSEWLLYPLFLRKKVKQCDIIFCWFAGWHSAFAVLISRRLKKKSIVVAGGYDCACVPEIGYGAFSKGRFWKEGLAAKYVFNNLDKALVVDLSLKDDIVKNAGVEGGNIDYLPTGYDPNYWRPKGKKEDIVLTVGTVSEPVIKRKGFETFVKAAKYLPDVEFVLVGKHADGSISRLESIAPSNVKFTGFVPDEELLKWYQKAKVYCQLSRYEGLTNALCEAMLCECIPVGTEYCGIPTAIGDTGFYVPYGDPKATAEAIRKALNAPDELRKDVRERIAKIFSLERREEELIKLIRTLRESR